MKLLLLLVVGVIAVASDDSCSYSSICPDNTMCLYKGFGSACAKQKFAGVTTQEEKDTIVNIHNELRRKLAKGEETRGNPGPLPGAANMNELSWDDELSTVAQVWADQCIEGHDKCRNVARFPVGQNIYLWGSTDEAADGTQHWDVAVNMWYDEVVRFNPDQINPFKSGHHTGHFTQVTWANTSVVGCGYNTYYNEKESKNRALYVCNYGTAGNVLGGVMYIVGEAGTQCPSGQQNDGLCVPPSK